MKIGDAVKTSDGRNGIVKAVGTTKARVWLANAPSLKQEEDFSLTDLETDRRTEVLEAIRDSKKPWSAKDVAEGFDLGETEAHWLLAGLERERLLDAGRGKGGLTIYRAVTPGTSIPWKDE